MKIKYEYKKSLIEKQIISEKEFLKEYSEGDYDYKNPYIKLNPYLINPLAAIICFKTKERTAVTITVKGKQKEGDISHTFKPSTNHMLPILGLYPDYKNTVIIDLYQGGSQTVYVDVPVLGERIPKLLHMKTTPEYMGDNIIFVTPSLSSLATGFDYNGDIRWHLNTPLVFDMKRLKNGNLLIGTERVMEMPYYMTGIYEMTMAGKIVNEYSIPGGYHHDQWEMEDGNILVLSDNPNYKTLEDQIVLLDRQSGEVIRRWDLNDCLTPGDGPSGGYTRKDWFHNNSLWYDDKTNSMILSGRHVDSIISINYDTGKLNWILGDPNLWPEEKMKYFFTPVKSDEFDWHYEQHSAILTTDGDIMCFDNGHYRSKNPDEFILNKDNFSRGVRYKINSEDMTVKQIWQYGKELGESFFSSYIGNVEYYGYDHYLVHSGGIQYDGEHASETPAALKQDDPSVRTESITVEIKNGKIMMELKITGNFYRAEKMKLYHEGDNLMKIEPKSLGSLGVTPESETVIDIDSCNNLIPFKYETQIIEEDDRFTFKGIFEGGQLLMLVLEQQEEKHGYFISTAKNKFNSFCSGTFIEKDPRSVNKSISKEGLKGIYDIRIIVDDNKYETGIKIKC